MTFDEQSIQRLKELGRQLPKELPKPTTKKEGSQEVPPKKHPIETEQDPNLLFKRLITASSDGQIPSHLISRLKEVEERQFNEKKSKDIKLSTKNKTNGNSLSSKEVEKEILYTEFDRFLSEDED